MTTARWNAAELEAWRTKPVDPEVDRLVEQVMTAAPEGDRLGRLGYNRLLGLADRLVETPELLLVEGSVLRESLALLARDNAALVDYFDPLPAPDWVDPEKLARGVGIWNGNALLVVAVLYAASLPACYLMKNGVPVLYDTDKLASHRYIFQRIYETGLMLDAVMQQGGIEVVEDETVVPAEERLTRALRRLDPEGDWKVEHGALVRGAGAEGGPDREAVERAVQEDGGPTRYIWGRGYVIARKVRFLHASMRWMMLNPDAVRPRTPAGQTPQSMSDELSGRTRPFDVERHGYPVNQEDMAFVLQTFAYLIPKGMEHWGNHLSRERKEGFLHLWKVVGHVMGIQPELMTDDWDEAGALYETILARQAGRTDAGEILTNAVMDFMRSYLPTLGGFDRRLAAHLIIDQLGATHAQLIVPADTFRACQGVASKSVYLIGRTGIRTYYGIRNFFLRHLPGVGQALGGVLERATGELIESWRGEFVRKPFYVPSTLGTWVRKTGVDEAFQARLVAWRQRVFNTVALSVVCLIAAAFASVPALVLLLTEGTPSASPWLWGVVAGLGLGVGLLTRILPRICDARPRLDHPTGVTRPVPAGPTPGA